MAGENYFHKLYFVNFFFFIKKNSTNQLAGYFTLLPGLLNFWADFLFWKFSLSDWSISIT